MCVGKVIDSINSAQELKGCTNITGPLEINIMGGSKCFLIISRNQVVGQVLACLVSCQGSIPAGSLELQIRGDTKDNSKILFLIYVVTPH